MNRYEAYIVVGSDLPLADDGVQKRLDRAYDIVGNYGYEIVSLEGEVHEVRKASTSLTEDNSRVYRVDETSCDCPDFENARGNLCKHRLAVRIFVLMNKKGE